MNKQNKIPRFKNEDEDEERAFWSINSPLDFLGDVEPVKLDLSHIKPTTKSVPMEKPRK